MNAGMMNHCCSTPPRRKNTACLSLVAVCLAHAVLHAAANDPFAVGYSMGNGGAVIQASGPSGRQPWNPACFYADTLRLGASVCGIDYYDAMDNLKSSRIVRANAGAWYARNRFVLKASYSHLNALDLYYEQQGFVSLGIKAFRALSASVELTANRAGFSVSGSENEKFMTGGVSLFVSGGSTALSVSCKSLPLKRASSEGFEPPITLDVGLHTTVHQFGAQGVVCSMTKESDYAFRFSIGESYFLSDHCALSGALSTNPFILHVGLSFSDARGGASIAFVNHPALGWSKGLTLDYAHR